MLLKWKHLHDEKNNKIANNFANIFYVNII